MSKDTLQVCVSGIDIHGKVTVTKAVVRFLINQLPRRRTVFDSFLTWTDKHCKVKNVPIRFVMESTGVYHEQLAWFLFQKDLSFSVILPNKAKHYLKSIGNNGAARAV